MSIITSGNIKVATMQSWKYFHFTRLPKKNNASDCAIEPDFTKAVMNVFFQYD